MSQYLRRYLELGLSQIVVVDHREKEVQSGYGLELTWETVVARKGNGYVRLVFHDRQSFAPNAGGSSGGVESEAIITATEYRDASKSNEVLDTPEHVKEIERQEAKIQERFAKEARLRPQRIKLYADLKRVTPKCPSCGIAMIQKKGKFGSFWGCSKFPYCDGKANISAEANRVLWELSKLGG